CHQYLSSFTF
nr:immunoglobulin light chain junction region [Mus musculus]